MQQLAAVPNGGASIRPDGRLTSRWRERRARERQNLQRWEDPQHRKDGRSRLTPLLRQRNVGLRCASVLSRSSPVLSPNGAHVHHDVGRKDGRDHEGEAGANTLGRSRKSNDRPAYARALHYSQGPTVYVAPSRAARSTPASRRFPSGLGSDFFADSAADGSPTRPATQTPSFATTSEERHRPAGRDDGSLTTWLRGRKGLPDRTPGDTTAHTAQHEDEGETGAARPSRWRERAPPLRTSGADGVDIPGANADDAHPSKLKSATFEVVVSNAHGSARGDPATVTVVLTSRPFPDHRPHALSGRPADLYAGEASDPMTVRSPPPPSPVGSTSTRGHFHTFRPEAFERGLLHRPNDRETARRCMHPPDGKGFGRPYWHTIGRPAPEGQADFLPIRPGPILLDGTPRTAPFTEEAVVA